MNSFFLKKASLIANGERNKWHSEIWKSDPYFICRMNQDRWKKTKQQEHDVRKTTSHNQLLHLSLDSACRDDRPHWVREADFYPRHGRRAKRVNGFTRAVL